MVGHFTIDCKKYHTCPTATCSKFKLVNGKSINVLSLHLRSRVNLNRFRWTTKIFGIVQRSIFFELDLSTLHLGHCHCSSSMSFSLAYSNPVLPCNTHEYSPQWIWRYHSLILQVLEHWDTWMVRNDVMQIHKYHTKGYSFASLEIGRQL